MKVILLTDIPKVGNRYDVKDFKEGYAQNVLIARGLAELATPKALAKLATKKADADKKREEEKKAFDQLIASINNIVVTIKVKANEKGHLFKAVSPKDVARAIKEFSGTTVDEDSIVMGAIKELGKHTVTIKKGGTQGKCEIIVEREK
jgi:large subunit ribosomal protein L9